MWSLKAKKGLVVKSCLIVLAVGIVAAVLYIEFVKKPAGKDNSAEPLANNSARLAASPSTVEKTVDDSTKAALSKSDYETYQNLQRSIALQYYYNNDNGNAERIMNDVIKKVPAGKVASSSYLLMASIQEQKHDVNMQKKYIQLAIDRLNDEGNSVQAANEQKFLDELK